MSDTSFGIERLGEVLTDHDGAYRSSQRHFTKPYKFCGNTKVRHSGIKVIPVCAFESSFEIDEGLVCVDLSFVGFLQYLAYREELVNSRLTRAEAALISPISSLTMGFSLSDNMPDKTLYTTLIMVIP